MLEFGLPFKLSGPLDFGNIFHNYFMVNFGNDRLFKEFSAFFTECTSLRKELDYASIATRLPSNPKLYDETEQKIIKFLRYEYLLDRSFAFQTGVKNSVNLSFSWLDSFNFKNAVNISNMKYEIAGHLYNFALNEYFNSIKLMTGVDIQQKKLAIAKFKVGAWALGEIKAFLPLFTSSAIKLPLDLSRSNLTIIENLMLGLAYISFLDLHEKDEAEFGILNIATIANEASKSFKIALELIMNDKEVGFPPEVKKQMHTAIYILYNISYSFTCMKLAVHYENLHADDQTKGYIGLNISYFKAGAKILQTFFQQKYDLNHFPSFLKDRLNEQNTFFSKGNALNEKKNTQIYKQKVYTENELPPLADINPQIKLEGVKPSAFSKPFEYDSIFEVLTNPEVQKNAEELRLMFEKKKKEIDEDLKKLSEKKMKAYVDSYVNFLLEKNVNSGNNPIGLPKTLEEKRKAFLSKGGFTKLSNAINNLKENSFNCQMLLEKIKEVLTTELNEDVKMKNAYQNGWSRMRSDQLNAEYWKQIRDLEGKVKIAQGIDGNIGQKFNTYSKYGETISKSPEELIKMMPNQASAENSSGNDLLQNIQKGNSDLVKLIETLKGLVSYFGNEVANLNYVEVAMTVKKNNTSLEAIFSSFEGKLLPNFSNLVAEIYKQIEEVCKLATAFNSSQKSLNTSSSSDAKIVEELTSAAMMLCETYDDVDQGLRFYESLFDLLLKLDKNVQDYACARELEKNALIQELTQKMGGMNFQGNFNPYH